MRPPPAHPRDPLGWSVLLVLSFVALGAVRLTVLDAPFFDEVHYLPAARGFLAHTAPLNLEHPPLGKELLSLGIALFGDRPLGWRIMPLAFGALALLGAMRAMWFASVSRMASVLTGFFLVTGFPLLVQARIAMLDIFMLGFVMLGLWMVAAVLREPETARSRLALAGVALGASVACKWNAAPVAVLPGLGFLMIRARDAGWRFVWARRGPPLPGMTLIEASGWLGVLPLAVYALSYWPLAMAPGNAFGFDLVALHAHMLELQEQVKTPHPYQSTWPQWVLNRRAIWYLYEPVGGVWRGVLMVGNPLTVLAGLPALGWCAWTGLRPAPDGRAALRARAGGAGFRPAALALAVLYAASLGLWIVAPKPVQFYYHYLLPGTFLLAALALALTALWERGQRIVPAAILLGATALFVFFYPVLTSAPLSGERAFVRWTWLDSWR